jgi:hypothetical protein
MPAPVLPGDELAIRQGAAWNEYKRGHVPGNTRRQVLAGGDKVTDQTASSHVTMANLFDTAFSTWANLRHEDDEQEHVNFRRQCCKEDNRFNGET